MINKGQSDEERHLCRGPVWNGTPLDEQWYLIIVINSNDESLGNVASHETSRNGGTC